MLKTLLKPLPKSGFGFLRSGKSKNLPVNITRDIKHVVVKHKNHNLLIRRNPDNEARIPEMFSRVARPCPPFCVQPMQCASGVETIGELEMLDYLKQRSEPDSNIVIFDSRMEDWVNRGTIPGSINIPWTKLTPGQGANSRDILNILKHNFGVLERDEFTIEQLETAIEKGNPDNLLDFSQAKTAILFCNGTWCGQTSKSIKSLIHFGYPAEKLKYFRNGMQGWVTLGLTTVSAEDEQTTECPLH